METMTFKQILNRDITSAFLNPFEFAEPHEVNGKICIVIFDDIENVEREKRMKSTMDGLYAAQKFLYISARSFGKLPAQGQSVTIDGSRYLVVDATDEAGVYGITLEATRNR